MRFLRNILYLIFPMADMYVIASVSSVINILEFGRFGWGLGFGSCEGIVVMAVGRSGFMMQFWSKYLSSGSDMRFVIAGNHNVFPQCCSVRMHALTTSKAGCSDLISGARRTGKQRARSVKDVELLVSRATTIDRRRALELVLKKVTAA
jgi:hypothetical protein